MNEDTTRYTEGKLATKGLPQAEVEGLISELYTMTADLKASIAIGDEPANMKQAIAKTEDLAGRITQILPYQPVPDDARLLVAYLQILLPELQRKGFYRVGIEEMPL